MEVTGMVAGVLAVRGWRRDGPVGLVPLLLFAGVTVEALLKEGLPQPGPPAGLHRQLPILPTLHVPLPFSYPSGHAFRTTFLAVFLAVGASCWARSVLATLVVVMALTRVYLADHWLSDVVGGLLLGLCLGDLALQFGPWRALAEPPPRLSSQRGGDGGRRWARPW
jgi:membrane-associated phospholipid phosphatase